MSLFAPVSETALGQMDAGRATLDGIIDSLAADATPDAIAHACAMTLVREINRPKKAETVVRHWLKWRPLLDYIASAGRVDLFAAVTLEFAERLSAHPSTRAGRLPAAMEMGTDNVREEE